MDFYKMTNILNYINLNYNQEQHSEPQIHHWLGRFSEKMEAEWNIFIVTRNSLYTIYFTVNYTF